MATTKDREALIAALTATNGDRQAAARLLDVNRTTVYNWLTIWPDVAKQFPPARTGRPKGSRDTLPRKRSVPWFAEVLGLPREFTSSQLTSAWRSLAAKHHPDAGGDSATFIRLRQAYEVAKKYIDN